MSPSREPDLGRSEGEGEAQENTGPCGSTDPSRLDTPLPYQTVKNPIFKVFSGEEPTQKHSPDAV